MGLTLNPAIPNSNEEEMQGNSQKITKFACSLESPVFLEDNTF